MGFEIPGAGILLAADASLAIGPQPRRASLPAKPDFVASLEKLNDSEKIHMANPFAQVAWAQQRTLVQAHAAIAARGRPRVKASNRNDSPGGTNEPGGIESVGLLRPGRPIREDVWKQCRRQSPSTQTHGPVFWLRTGDATARAKSPGIHPAINRLPADGDVGSGFWLTFVRPLQRRVRGGF